MNLDSAWLLERLTSLTGSEPASRWLVAFSGGLDSTVLLHLLCQTPAIARSDILAIHVDHGLHPESAAWAEHCRDVAVQLGVNCSVQQAKVDSRSGESIEAAAREARYSILRAATRAGDCVLSAHHASDQAETLLLNLLRGSGPAGLAGIGAVQRFGTGRLLRPLLCRSDDAIRGYAECHGIHWLEDPSNTDVRFDRNFLRHDVLPVLASRWPAVSARLAQSASLASESDELQKTLADIDIAAAGHAGRLDIGRMRGLTRARQRNLLRRAVSLCALPPPPATRLYQAVDELLLAREDAEPRVHWPGAELRRYRQCVYVMPTLSESPAPPAQLLLPGVDLPLGPACGRLQLVPDRAGGINPALALAGLGIRYRSGGESIRPAGRKTRQALKKLLQQAGIVPWMRDRLPLLYAGDKLVAVADLWISDEATHPAGFDINWQHSLVLK